VNENFFTGIFLGKISFGKNPVGEKIPKFFFEISFLKSSGVPEKIQEHCRERKRKNFQTIFRK